mgnify:CR=1 FL=1
MFLLKLLFRNKLFVLNHDMQHFNFLPTGIKIIVLYSYGTLLLYRSVHYRSVCICVWKLQRIIIQHYYIMYIIIYNALVLFYDLNKIIKIKNLCVYVTPSAATLNWFLSRTIVIINGVHGFISEVSVLYVSLYAGLIQRFKKKIQNQVLRIWTDKEQDNRKKYI